MSLEHVTANLCLSLELRLESFHFLGEGGSKWLRLTAIMKKPQGIGNKMECIRIRLGKKRHLMLKKTFYTRFSRFQAQLRVHTFVERVITIIFFSYIHYYLFIYCYLEASWIPKRDLR